MFRENRVADNGGNVPILHDLAVFFCQPDQQLSVGIVDISDGGELKTREWLDVRQIGPVKIDVMKSHEKNKGSNRDSDAGCADYKANRPTQPAPVGATKLLSCRQGARPHPLEPIRRVRE
jgi:hypothetical protein